MNLPESQMPSLLSALFASIASVGLLGLAWLLGSALLARTPVRSGPSLERPLFAVGVGLGTLAYLPLLLGAARMLTPVGVRIALLLCAACGMAALRWRSASPLPSSDSLRAPLPAPGYVRAVVAVAVLFLVVGSISALTPMVDYDGLAYHVAAPKRWLELGTVAYLPTHLHTQWPMGTEMLYTLLLPVGGDGACKPLIVLFAFLTAAAIVALGQRLASRSVGLVAAGLFVLYAGMPSLDTTSVEMALAFFVVASALALSAAEGSLAATDKAMRRFYLALAAVLAGEACCVKLNGLLCVAVLAVAILVLASRERTAWTTRLGQAGSFVGIAILCALPWYARTWINTGNPFYPFAYALFGGRDWNASGSHALSAYFRSFDLPGTTLAAREAYVRIHSLKLLACTALGAAIPGLRWARGFVVAAGGFALAQVSVSHSMRFLLPAAPFVALVLAAWFLRIIDRRPILGWLLPIVLAIHFVPLALRDSLSSLPIVLGQRSRIAEVERYVNNHDAFLWANRNLPSDARVVYGPDNRTYFLQRDVFWSSAVFQRQIVYDTPELFWASLRRSRITYLILNGDLYKDSAISFETKMGWRENERRRLAEAAARSEKLWEGQGVAVYRLPADSPGR